MGVGGVGEICSVSRSICFGFVEQGGVLGEERDEGLTDGDAVAELGVHLDAGVGADRRAGVGTAGTEALHRPADLLAVHCGKKARAGCGKGARRGGVVEGGGRGEGVLRCGVVVRLHLDHLEEAAVGGAVGEELRREECTGFGRGGLSAEVEHVARERVGQREEVGGEAKLFRRKGEGALRREVLKEFEALLDLDPVATRSGPAAGPSR